MKLMNFKTRKRLIPVNTRITGGLAGIFNLRMQEETFGLTMIYNVDSGGGSPFDSAETMQIFTK